MESDSKNDDYDEILNLIDHQNKETESLDEDYVIRYFYKNLKKSTKIPYSRNQEILKNNQNKYDKKK